MADSFFVEELRPNSGILIPEQIDGARELDAICRAVVVAAYGEDYFKELIKRIPSRSNRTKIRQSTEAATRQYVSPTSEKAEEFRQAVESKRTTITDEYITEEEAMHEEHQQ